MISVEKDQSKKIIPVETISLEKKSIRRKHINRTTSFLFSFFHFLMFSLSYSHFRICPFSHFLIFSFSLFYPFLSFFFAFLIFLIFSICSFFYYLIFISQLLGTRAHTQWENEKMRKWENEKMRKWKKCSRARL